MKGGSMEVDYLVVGAGAAGMAFTDALIDQTDATVLMVDRRHSPGGHWNDAYPFVRLHQPSAFYGVSSRRLGEDRIDVRGPNAGFYERATAAEVCHYFQAVMDERLLASGQVEFLPMTSFVSNGGGAAVVTSRLTGRAREVTVRRKIVDARYLESSVPATHTPTFEVADGVRCIPVNDLVRSDEPAGGYVVLGAGKTAMDACSWLLENGVDSDRISWVKPRDAWVTDRAALQPREKVGDFFVGFAASVEASALATSIPDLFARLEACGALVRLDRSVEPTMFRGAILSAAERDRLQSIHDVIRAGRARRLMPDRIEMEGGTISTGPDRLYVDCTADALPQPPPRPIFESDRITLQQLREGSPTFNAALLGFLEGTLDDPEEKNRLAPPSVYPNTAHDWIRVRHLGMVAQSRWDQHPEVTAWIERSRLNIVSGLMAHAAEPAVGEAFGRYVEHSARAIENLAAFRVQLGDEITL